MTNQTFTVAGVSTLPSGLVKARFGNDLVGRIKKLKDNTNHNMIELPQAMTKAEAATFLLEKEEFQSAENRDALTKVVFRNVPKRKSVSVPNTPVQLNSEKVD